MRRIRTRKDHGYYLQTLSPTADLSGGAAEFVFDAAHDNPLQVFRGPGRLAGEFGAVAPAMVALAPQGAPQGSPRLTQNPAAVSTPESAVVGGYN